MAALANLGGDAVTMYVAGKAGGKLGDVGDAAADTAKDAAQSLVRRVAGSAVGGGDRGVELGTVDVELPAVELAISVEQGGLAGVPGATVGRGARAGDRWRGKYRGD